jgi:hypothetical protein
MFHSKLKTPNLKTSQVKRRNLQLGTRRRIAVRFVFHFNIGRLNRKMERI